MTSRIVNFLLYQIGWFACAFGAASGFSVAGGGMALLLVAVHFAFTTDRRSHALLSIIAGLLGVVVETSLMRIGVYDFPSQPRSFVPPLWIVVMWIQFSTLFPFCLRWLSGRYLLASILGLLGGPLAFVGGETIGAVTFLPPRTTHVVILGVFWSIAMPLLVYACDRLLGRSRIPCAYSWPQVKSRTP